jgi:hypothetical protein
MVRGIISMIMMMTMITIQREVMRFFSYGGEFLQENNAMILEKKES